MLYNIKNNLIFVYKFEKYVLFLQSKLLKQITMETKLMKFFDRLFNSKRVEAVISWGLILAGVYFLFQLLR